MGIRLTDIKATPSASPEGWAHASMEPGVGDLSRSLEEREFTGSSMGF